MDIGRTSSPEVASSDASMRPYSFLRNDNGPEGSNNQATTNFIKDSHVYNNFDPTSSGTGETRGNYDAFDFAPNNIDTTSTYPSLEAHPHSLDHSHLDVDNNVNHKFNQDKNTAMHQPLSQQSMISSPGNTIDNHFSSEVISQPTQDPRLRFHYTNNSTIQHQSGNQNIALESITSSNQINRFTQMQRRLEENSVVNTNIHSLIGENIMDSHNPWSNAASTKVETISESGTAERKEHEDDGQSAASTATATTASPSLQPLHSDVVEIEPSISGNRLPPSFNFGTPSTVSSSADEVSVDGIDQQALDNLALKIEEETKTTIIQRRPTSLNTMPQQTHGIYPGISHPNTQQSQWTQRPSTLMPTPSQNALFDAWGRETTSVQPYNEQQAVFDASNPYNYSNIRHPRHYNENHYSYSHFPPPHGQYHLPKRPGPPLTPPRVGNRPNRTGQRQSGPANQSTSSGSANPPRSSSEVLKTLLRKKACLYEPDTSRAVALVTWLVGRELALEYGYFSRQQLQSGVHACVANKINSGKITRTKVNRCMQIILNSCFHYIIPRPDGSEENGDSFRKQFAERSQDDRLLLDSLSDPWSDVQVERSAILQAFKVEEEETGNPTSEADSRRAVLLCFNENVRSAVDVFRCHNEFIRDTANASKLQLTANEWRSFFGCDFGISPVRNNNIPTSARSGDQDYLGQMDEAELATFRTSWCSKRYDHDHRLCGFSHLEISGGWLRRNPLHFNYGTKMCKNIVSVKDNFGVTKFVINRCCEGEYCKDAHSEEEILYHPSIYKKNICKASSQAQGCSLGDVCPNLHPHYSQHHVRKPVGDYRAQNRHPNNRNNISNIPGRSVAGTPPDGAPMLYVNPAPFSMFEKQLQMPGLQQLFRRHSSVLCAHLACAMPRCNYQNFGDDWGIDGVASEDNTSKNDLERKIFWSTKSS